MFESLKVMLDQELDSFFYHVTLVRGIRNSEYLYNHEQIAVFVPWGDGDQNFWTHLDV